MMAGTRIFFESPAGADAGLLEVSAHRNVITSRRPHTDRLDGGSSNDFRMSGTCISLARGMDACENFWSASRIQVRRLSREGLSLGEPNSKGE